ncbi:MAG: hypothetical protein M0004_05550 [Actinomycetota bacterium]|nr:hypothetical protein [Actinomycetota bacterium]
MSEGARYRFGPRDRRGLVAGQRTGQLVVLGVALVAAVLLVRSQRPVGLAGATVLVLVAAGIVWLPIRGRSTEEWAPVVARFLLRRRRGERRPFARRGPGGEQVVDADVLGRRFGVVLDPAHGTASAALAVGEVPFVLLDDAARSQRVGAWCAVLDALAERAAVVHRIQWIERVHPALAPPGLVAAPMSGDALAGARASYAALVRAERTTSTHELVLVLSIRSLRLIRGLSTERAGLLGDELDALAERCRAAGLSPTGPLSADALARLVRRFGEARPNDRFGTSAPWPSIGERRWDRVRAGGMWHASYWVAEWPRQEVGSDFLAPLVLSGAERRTISLVMAPVPALAAQRAAEQARTSRVADAELKRRHGFAVSARAHREDEAVTRRELELAAGHAGYRFSGYLTVSAETPDELESACGRLEQLGAVARLDLRRLDGEHDEAMVTALPLGRGCA